MKPISVVVAEDSDSIRGMIRRILSDDPEILVVGEARNFSDTVITVADLKPTVVLLDLHMPDEHDYPPHFVKDKLLGSTAHVIAMSIWTEDDAKELAARYGAQLLLDKVTLGTELIPVLKELRRKVM
jgi:chemotaxis response regulator CheB